MHSTEVYKHGFPRLSLCEIIVVSKHIMYENKNKKMNDFVQEWLSVTFIINYQEQAYKCILMPYISDYADYVMHLLRTSDNFQYVYVLKYNQSLLIYANY